MNPITLPPLAVGDRVTFAEEKLGYTVQAVSPDGRWAACTKPFRARGTVVYTVLDTLTQVRGRDDHHGLGYETREQCERAISMFASGEAEHSHRYPPIPLVATRLVRAADAEEKPKPRRDERINPTGLYTEPADPAGA